MSLTKRQDKGSRLSVEEMDSNLTYLEDLALNNNNNYLVYTALVTQTGTGSTPSATVLENTIGELTWEYVSPGRYELKSDGAFILGKTYLNNQVFHLLPGFLNLITNIINPDENFDPEVPDVPEVPLVPGIIEQIPFYFSFLTRIDVNTIQLAAGILGRDGVLSNHSLEIRVYSGESGSSGTGTTGTSGTSGTSGR